MPSADRLDPKRIAYIRELSQESIDSITEAIDELKSEVENNPQGIFGIPMFTEHLRMICIIVVGTLIALSVSPAIQLVQYLFSIDTL